MASTSNVAQKQMASISSIAQKEEKVAGEVNFSMKMSCRELWLTQNRVDQASFAVTCASSIPERGV